MSGVLKRTWATGPDELLHHDPKRPLFDRNTTWCNQLIKGCACWFMRRKQPKPTLKGQQHSLPGRSSSNEKECKASGDGTSPFRAAVVFHPQTGAEVLAKQSWKWFFSAGFKFVGVYPDLLYSPCRDSQQLVRLPWSDVPPSNLF